MALNFKDTVLKSYSRNKEARDLADVLGDFVRESLKTTNYHIGIDKTSFRASGEYSASITFDLPKDGYLLFLITESRLSTQEMTDLFTDFWEEGLLGDITGTQNRQAVRFQDPRLASDIDGFIAFDFSVEAPAHTLELEALTERVTANSVDLDNLVKQLDSYKDSLAEAKTQFNALKTTEDDSSENGPKVTSEPEPETTTSTTTSKSSESDGQ